MTGEEYCGLLETSAENAHSSLFEEYYSYVRTIVFNRLRSVGSSEDVEECISDIFAELFFSLGDNCSSGELKGFVGTVAKRTAIDRFRSLSVRSGRTLSMDDKEFTEPESDTDIVSESEARELRRLVVDCIKSLGEPDSTILIQKFYYNRSSREVGDILSMKPAAVRMRSKRAAEKLREILIARGVIL